MQYRIGINLGDVMVENGDLFRRRQLRGAPAGLGGSGGIMISGAVHDLVGGKLDVANDYLGLQEVMNIAAARWSTVSCFPCMTVGAQSVSAGRAQPNTSFE
jgi:class 3 adenylate cyclase